MALVVLSVVEQRLDAVRAVLAGATVTEVAEGWGVSRQSVHTWLGRYLAEGIGGLADRSRRPANSPRRSGAGVEVAVVEMRRAHPRWGARRIRLELQRDGLAPAVAEAVAADGLPAERTINRILIRHGLAQPRPRKRPKSSFKRFERPRSMQLWGIDIVGGVELVDAVTGELREAKIVTGVDDHSRYCVMAAVVEHATKRAVCLAFAQALARFGVPEEVITDNGKQFTNRFGKGGEVLFDKICRKNGITHRLTEPASPNQNGKVERFHGTLRRELLDDLGPMESVQQAQSVIDAWVAGYNSDRPHQALDVQVPVMPDDRFAPAPATDSALVELWLPPSIKPVEPVEEPPATAPPAVASEPTEPSVPSAATEPSVSTVEFERVVPASGNLGVAGKQFWAGPARAGQTLRFWADCDLIHLFAGEVRIKTVRSHLSTADLTRLLRQGARPGGPSPMPAMDGSEALEVDRVVGRTGIVSLASQQILAAEVLAGRPVTIRIEPATLMFFDPDTRELLRTRTNPIPVERLARIRGVRAAGPPPRPATEPARVQRRVTATGCFTVARQTVAIGRTYAGMVLTIHVSEHTLAVELDDGETRTIRRTTSLPIRNIKADRPRTSPNNS